MWPERMGRKEGDKLAWRTGKGSNAEVVTNEVKGTVEKVQPGVKTVKRETRGTAGSCQRGGEVEIIL